MPSTNDTMHASSFLQGHNSEYIEQLYARYMADPSSVDPTWIDFFKSLDDAPEDVAAGAAGAPWSRSDWPPQKADELTAALDGQWAEAPAKIGEKIASAAKADGQNLSSDDIQNAAIDSMRALMIIRAYRIRGHLIADLDPLDMRAKDPHPELDPEFYGFKEIDMDRPIFLDNVLGMKSASMRQIIEKLRKTYCGTFALQYMHLSNPEEAGWLKERIENYDKEGFFTTQGRKAILNKMVEAEGFEKFCHVKYSGTKRFGLDGGEALIPAMEQIIKRGGALGVKDIIIGMPHRGRLNVLVNVMSKPYRAIFNEFLGGSYKPDDVEGSGDVKYHLGASSDREFDGNSVHLSLTANPSHLEAVNPVVLGKARAKGDQMGRNRNAVMPILLHGDAAFAGQGVIAECFGLSGLKGHKTGGTIHIVVNNQIGFTTSPHKSRSSPYPTDISFMVEAPIFHVNGDDPEAVVHAAKVATEFRQKFEKDVVIDIFCYRRFGHNEGDEPMFTQPTMYKKIKSHPTSLTLYTQRLVRDGLIPEGEIEDMKTAFQMRLNEEFEAGKAFKPNKADWLDGRWSHLQSKDPEYQRGKTHITEKRFKEVGAALTKLPEGWAPHRTIQRILNAKEDMISSGTGIDWATAEALAFGTLQVEGFPVRLSGQDCTRGTFSHRHSGILDQNTGLKHYPLNNIRPDQEGHYEVIDSMLSEYAVLGYEYGYSLAEPNALTLWEAQFGDFANGAQIMIDQFISSGESKWLRMSGLVMLLPHGFEGQGPEHSSARPERFLQMCAEDNWVIANCTTPANYFHILRRQMHRPYRKPLVIMTPKSLLRHKGAVSTMDEFTGKSSFHRILWDDAERGNSDTKLVSDSKIKRVVVCSGKVYYDLLEERDKRGITDIYLMRLEQLYPYAKDAMREEFTRFKNAEFVWCQEEPKNQGAWLYINPHIENALIEAKCKKTRPTFAGRAPASAPATGLAAKHKIEQAALVNDALTLKG
ncbi:2-oxoglutarate dehydrogenase subunit E1 [Amylibacter marinus]|uniref:2-oxoglutarate dehydrogenase E1 component n=1 Tax=Amylibacter marinus TaxID=1475483 RepID=A0ABQ5VTN4_9RHOB|nr:2-oxoglutarate dehydrogenase E1 component [Amylibacter marinus]GLQ34519.1 2-oxoglutarate dehydrogenase subunit E1 [Amylibacter marinus]